MRNLKFALIVDKSGWAYFNIAYYLKSTLQLLPGIQVEIIPISYPKSWNRVVAVLEKDFDHIHFFWRAATKNLTKKSNVIITTSVYDHLDFELGWVWNPKNPLIDGFWVSSKKLQNLYANCGISQIPVLTDGVDTSFFTNRKNSLRNTNTITIGWVGNPNWGFQDHKGLNTIVKPALKIVSRNRKIDLKVAGGKTIYPYTQMPDFYQKLDLLLCSSKSEGTPNPILEASALGLPWLSTNVGIVEEFRSYKEWNLGYERDPVSLADKILAIYESGQIRDLKFSKSLVDESNEWDWQIKSREIANFLLSFH